MNRHAQNEFLDKTTQLIHTLKSSDKKISGKKENTFTTKILIPLIENGLNLDADFDDRDDTGKRPDVKAFAKPRKKNDGPVLLVESKWPTDFIGNDTKEIIAKYLDDKFVPYIIASKFTCKYFLIHSFDRYLVTKVDDSLIKVLESYKNKKELRLKVVEHILTKTTEFNFIANPKKIKSVIGSFIGFLDSHVSLESLSADNDQALINSVVLSSDRDLRVIGEKISDLVGDGKNADGLLKQIKFNVTKELSKTVGSLKMAYRHFLSTRRPEIESGKELEKEADSEKRETFLSFPLCTLLLVKSF